MRIFVSCLALLVLSLAACAPATKNEQMGALWNKFDAHCSAHAAAASSQGSPDEEALYRECMDYFVKADAHCSYCVVKGQ